MKTLILTCNTGQGHNATAASVKEIFIKHNECCEIADTLAFLSKRASKFIGDCHVRIYRYAPKAFKVGYKYVENSSSRFGISQSIYKLLTLGVEKMYEYVRDGGYDNIICTHVFSALAVTEIKKRYNLKIITSFILTDYTCYPTVDKTDMDFYFIPSDKIADDFVSVGIPKEKLIGSGIPVRSEFLDTTDPVTAKSALGIKPTYRHILMMCGSMGCGPMENIAAELYKKLPGDVIITVVCGTNKRLFQKLSKKFAKFENLRVLGYTDNIPLQMDSADIFLTKPGGISVSESHAKRLPLVLIDAVAGCEKYNLKFFLDNRMAFFAQKPSEIAALCNDLLAHKEKLTEIKENMEKMYAGNASEKIYSIIFEAMEETK